MTTANMLRLVLLAAVWGSSFLFTRIAVPVLGPAVLIQYRVACAALLLAMVGVYLKKRLDLAANWKHYLILGFFNSAFPFLLFAYAATTLTASVLSVLNATAPMWGALIGAALGRERLSAKKVLGLLLGACGVALLVGFDAVTSQPGAALAIGATLVATICYSVAGTYAKSAQSAKPLEPFANAHGSMWASTLLVLPALALFPSPAAPTAGVMAATLVLGVVCTGAAYIVYFKLIDDVGPTSALTVTFLTPVFGILWGALFLGEIVGWHTMTGAAIVIIGTAMVTGFTPGFTARAIVSDPLNKK